MVDKTRINKVAEGDKKFIHSQGPGPDSPHAVKFFVFPTIAKTRRQMPKNNDINKDVFLSLMVTNIIEAYPIQTNKGNRA
ncbi:MAG: hypothetical protein GXP53_06550 [Deltaproteobacteria bacterium]|nr:hypothetical protein [Deltaproteobacteria bacterium]